MQRDDFIHSPTGMLVPTEKGQWAFVPHALPPRGLDFARLSKPLSEAAAALGELNGVGRLLSNPYLLITPLQRREVISSSSMEGTYTTVDALLLAEATHEAATTPDTREVINYRTALTAAIAGLAETPLCLRTLKQAHATMLQNVRRDRGASVRPGEFKQHQNFIGAYEIEKARFIPPPPRETLDCLDALERYFHPPSAGEDDTSLDVLIDSALIHYQFETIHPFSDGNGRVGRMLIILHLFMRQKLIQPLLYLSPVFEARKEEYIDRMYAVSRYGDWEGWIIFFLSVMRDSAKEAVQIAEKILDLQARYRHQMQQARRSANVLTIIDFLFEQPVVSIPIVKAHLDVTYRAAQKNIEMLMAENIVTEIPGRSNPRLFVARDIIQIISGN